MKKILLFVSFMTVCCLFSKAQSETVDGNVNTEVDSLKMVVQDLQDQVNEKDLVISEMETEKHYEKVWGKRKKYMNLGYCIMNLDGMPLPESNFGLGISMGRTYNLHKKPVAGMIMFGIDFSYLDFTFASFDNTGGYGLSLAEDLDIDLKRNYLSYSMQVGPSVTVNPVDELKVGVYCRFAPSMGFVTMNDYAYLQFVPYVTCGLSVSYKVIGLGIEGRWGKADYKGFSLDEESMTVDAGDINNPNDMIPNMNEMFKTSKKTFKDSSLKIYLSFRF